VSTFINKLHGLLSGDGEEDTKISTCSTASMAVHRAGLVLGTGSTPPSLSDTAIETVASDASLAYSSVTFQAPVGNANQPPGVDAEVRGLIQNNKSSAFYINEIALYGKKNASAAAGGAQMFSRDLVYETGKETPIVFAADSDMRFDFKFKTTMSATGGLVVNFSKLVYNLFFKGSAAPTGSKITSVGGAQPTYTYGNASMSGSKTFMYIQGGAVQYYWGIVLGSDMPDTPTGPQGSDSVAIDTTTFYDFKPEEFTCSANTISSVTTGNGQAYFTISRTFTNAGTTSKNIDKVGILCKGTSTGGAHTASAAAINTNQFLITANTPTGGNVSIQPNQTYRVTYTFQIQV